MIIQKYTFRVQEAFQILIDIAYNSLQFACRPSDRSDRLACELLCFSFINYSKIRRIAFPISVIIGPRATAMMRFETVGVPPASMPIRMAA